MSTPLIILISVILILIINFITSRYFYDKSKLFFKKSNQKLKNDLTVFLGKIERQLVSPFKEFKSSDSNKSWTIVFTYNRKTSLLQTLEDITRYEPETKIMVIDNGSSDGTRSTLTEFLSNGKIHRILLNEKESVPQWQKCFNIQQALRLLSIEEVSYITWIDDDIQIKAPWINMSTLILKEQPYKNIKVVNLLTDDIQEKAHPTLETINFQNTQIKIKSSMNGAFVFVPVSFFEEFGLPPIREGINDASVEDWYYSRLLQASEYKVAAIDNSTHAHYNDSSRGRAQTQTKA